MDRSAFLDPGDLTSERWLRGEGGVKDALRAEARHRLGLTHSEMRAGARPRRRLLPDAGQIGTGRSDPGLARVELRDEANAALRLLSPRERVVVVALAYGIPMVAVARHLGVTKSRVSQIRCRIKQWPLIKAVGAA